MLKLHMHFFALHAALDTLTLHLADRIHPTFNHTTRWTDSHDFFKQADREEEEGLLKQRRSLATR